MKGTVCTYVEEEEEKKERKKYYSWVAELLCPITYHRMLIPNVKKERKEKKKKKNWQTKIICSRHVGKGKREENAKPI